MEKHIFRFTKLVWIGLQKNPQNTDEILLIDKSPPAYIPPMCDGKLGLEPDGCCGDHVTCFSLLLACQSQAYHVGDDGCGIPSLYVCETGELTACHKSPGY